MPPPFRILLAFLLLGLHGSSAAAEGIRDRLMSAYAEVGLGDLVHLPQTWLANAEAIAAFRYDVDGVQRLRTRVRGHQDTPKIVEYLWQRALRYDEKTYSFVVDASDRAGRVQVTGFDGWEPAAFVTHVQSLASELVGITATEQSQLWRLELYFAVERWSDPANLIQPIGSVDNRGRHTHLEPFNTHLTVFEQHLPRPKQVDWTEPGFDMLRAASSTLVAFDMPRAAAVKDAQLTPLHPEHVYLIAPEVVHSSPPFLGRRLPELARRGGTLIGTWMSAGRAHANRQAE